MLREKHGVVAPGADLLLTNVFNVMMADVVDAAVIGSDISAGLGVGANLLVGGTRKSVSLQPLSVEGQVGVNLALGVARMKLKPIN